MNSLQIIKQSKPEYKKWEQNQNSKELSHKKALQNIEISEKELNEVKNKAKTILRAVDIMDTYSEERAESMEVATQYAGAIGQLSTSALVGYSAAYLFEKTEIARKVDIKLGKFAHIYGDKFGYLFTNWKHGGYPITIAIFILSIPFFNNLYAKYKKQSSRIGRFEARKEKLNDPKNFVIYTNKQMQEAEKIALSISDEEVLNDNKLKLGVFSTLMAFKKKKRDYEVDFNNRLNDNKKHFEELNNKIINNEIIKEAKKDQDLILKLTKKIELYSQKYSEKIEEKINIIEILAALKEKTVLTNGHTIRGWNKTC